ncbi:MAG: hypothetical protein H6766_07005 [Candidatus Peribacteria bacterium]|nr:MAG: hypothetical protein H6766_07005 [Candidatus Peribacteria bacterium]
MSEIIANESDLNEDILGTIDPSLRAPLRRIYNNLHLTWSDDVVTIDELDAVSLTITSDDSIADDISLSLTTTGAQCIVIDDQNTCQTPITIQTE